MGDKYEHKTVKALRGADRAVIAKLGKRGWELTGQTPGTLRTDLTFRRSKPRMSRQTFAIGAVVVVCVGAITVGVLTEGDAKEGKGSAPSASSSSADADTADMVAFLAALKRGDLQEYAEEHYGDPMKFDAQVTGLGPDTLKSGGFINLLAVVDGAVQEVPLLKLIWGGFDDIPFPGNDSFGPGDKVRVRASIGRFFSDKEVWLSPDEAEGAFITAR